MIFPSPVRVISSVSTDWLVCAIAGIAIMAINTIEENNLDKFMLYPFMDNNAQVGKKWNAAFIWMDHVVCGTGIGAGISL
ncbi:MAG: hypothetical protein AAGU21_03325 [Solidesulfovibrio sp.]|uniref:hypothetical protein n=1 Tax=Solidesulfovibrio sp. TaxID=2910990 RepID=UPI0031597100